MTVSLHIKCKKWTSLNPILLEALKKSWKWWCWNGWSWRSKSTASRPCCDYCAKAVCSAIFYCTEPLENISPAWAVHQLLTTNIKFFQGNLFFT